MSYFQPDWNQKNMAWVSKDCTKSQIAKRARAVTKVLYTIFFDTRGAVTQIPTPVGQSVTCNFYLTSVLPKVVEHYKERRPKTGMRGIKLWQDNAPAHTCKVTVAYLKEQHIDVLPHQPYSPDLTPCDFYLFPKLNYNMG